MEYLCFVCKCVWHSVSEWNILRFFCVCVGVYIWLYLEKVITDVILKDVFHILLCMPGSYEVVWQVMCRYP